MGILDPTLFRYQSGEKKKPIHRQALAQEHASPRTGAPKGRVRLPVAGDDGSTTVDITYAGVVAPM